MRKIGTFLLALLLAAIIAAAGAVYWLAGVFDRAHPLYAGSVTLPSLSQSVHVYRDEHGIPHIFASNLDDAARALGYIHADERFFQMEMQRRAGQGRLSEVLGSDMLGVDKFTRTLGFYRLAEVTYAALSPEAQKRMNAYAEGVNLWLDSHRGRMPPEFLMLRYQPEKWVPADSLVWARLMALQLSENYKREALRAELSRRYSSAQIAALIPPPPPASPVTTQPQAGNSSGPLFPPGPVPDTKACEAGFDARRAQAPTSFFALMRSALHDLQEKTQPQPARTAMEELGRITGMSMAASNEWVISGSRSASGKPILANDPHLGLEAPILWYLARIVTPQRELEGATVPGLPVVLLGQNGHIAWGFTTTGSDVQDLFIETIDPSEPGSYLVPGGAAKFEARHEIIHVKDAPDVDLNVRATRHGPVLSDIEPDLADLAGPGKVMALAFTALAPDDATPEALLRINSATDWASFKDALKLYKSPPQNIVYADTAGNIGFVAAGIVPVRKKGDGLTPADGASGDYDWNSMIPFEEWPQVLNPSAGFVFNANNAVVAQDSSRYYGEDWEEPYRALRLQQFFDVLQTHTLDSSAMMQADHLSLATERLLPFLYRLNPSDPREAQAMALLRNWNGMMDCARPEPLIFTAWVYELHKLIAEQAGSELGPLGPFDAQAIEAALGGEKAAICGADGCDTLSAKAFRAGIALLTQRDGEDMAAWRWGHEHAARLQHKFYSHLPVLKEVSDLSIPSSGDFYTLDRGGGDGGPDAPFARTHGGGFRGIYDLSDPTQSRFMIATGESGYPLSAHYGDLVEPWNEVRGLTLTGSEADFAKGNAPELVFVPR